MKDAISPLPMQVIAHRDSLSTTSVSNKSPLNIVKIEDEEKLKRAALSWIPGYIALLVSVFRSATINASA